MSNTNKTTLEIEKKPKNYDLLLFLKDLAQIKTETDYETALDFRNKLEEKLSSTDNEEEEKIIKDWIDQLSIKWDRVIIKTNLIVT